MRRAFMLLASLVVLSPLFLSLQVSAQSSNTATLDWINPTTRTNGLPVVLSEVRVYREVDGEQIWNRIVTLPPGIQTYIDENLFNGRYCYRLTAVDTAGLESVPSNTACKTISITGNVPRPLAPSGLTVR